MRESFSLGSVFSRNSKILVLGSFPSVQSRTAGFYYANPQNRFWRVLAAVYQEAVPEMVEGKRALLLSHGLALWDALECCEIQGSGSANMRGAIPVDIETVTRETKTRRVLIDGTTAAKYYARYLEAETGTPAVCLPSMSPANASYRLERLTELWGVALLRKESRMETGHVLLQHWHLGIVVVLSLLLDLLLDDPEH